MCNLILVDDDQGVLDLLKVFLRAGGHSVITANSGVPALDILDSDQPLDLMLTDVTMPGLNGFNLARMARIRRPGLKILYLSGGDENAQIARDQGDRLGKMLTKPIQSQELAREVEAALVAPSSEPHRSGANAQSSSEDRQIVDRRISTATTPAARGRDDDIGG
jgi:CheY-like chemotaxis protein